VRGDGVHAGAVKPRGFFPVKSVMTWMDLSRTSSSCRAESWEMNSCV
jgi:hypothetical protein